MSSTITIGKAAAAFKAPDGTLRYILCEKSYSSNVFPQTPSWGSAFPGSIERTIRLIFQFASSCEGGGLRGRSGPIKPESYITAWLKELRNPFEMPDLTVRLAVGDGYNAAIPVESAQDVRSLLVSLDRADLAASVQAGDGLCLSLHRDADLLAAICRSGKVSFWRLLDRHLDTVLSSGQRNRDLGYAPTRSKDIDVPRPNVRRVSDRYDMLMQRHDGTWRYAGWESEVVSDYIASLWESEITQPGSSTHRIPFFRSAIQEAPSVPLGMVVAVERTGPLTKYQEEDIESLIRRFSTTPTESGFQVTVTEESLLSLVYLPRDRTAWLLPEQPPETAAPIQAPVAVPAPRQMSLF